MPLADNVMDWPLQMVSRRLATIEKGCTTVMLTESLLKHPKLLLPVTIYFAEVAGLATGLVQAVQLRVALFFQT